MDLRSREKIRLRSPVVMRVLGLSRERLVILWWDLGQWVLVEYLFCDPFSRISSIRAYLRAGKCHIRPGVVVNGWSIFLVHMPDPVHLTCATWLASNLCATSAARDVSPWSSWHAVLSCVGSRVQHRGNRELLRACFDYWCDHENFPSLDWQSAFRMWFLRRSSTYAMGSDLRMEREVRLSHSNVREPNLFRIFLDEIT